jgi:hypothetical protein
MQVEAVLVCLTFCRWMKALELLYELKWASLSALFADACVENHLLQETDLNVAIHFNKVWTRASEWAKKTLGDEELATKYALSAERSILAAAAAETMAKVEEAAEAEAAATASAEAAAAEAAAAKAVLFEGNAAATAALAKFAAAET